MARGESTPLDEMNKKIIAANINNLLKKRNKKQIDIHNATKIPKSTLTGYVKGTSLPNFGNIQKIADFFSVPKSEIDPRFVDHKEVTKGIKSTLTVLENKNKNELLSIYNKLDSQRKMSVIDFTKLKLKEQENEKFSSLDEYRKKEPDAIDTLAAHSPDRKRQYTEQEVEDIKDYLDSIIEEKRNKDK